MCRTSPRRLSDDGGTDRSPSCSGVRPAHFCSRVARWKSSQASTAARSPSRNGGSTRSGTSGNSVMGTDHGVCWDGHVLRIGPLDVPDGRLVVMAIVNRTPDSFYDRGATYELEAALARVDQVVAEGADMVDVGGGKAAPGAEVDAAEEIRRTVDLVAAIRAAHPRLPISIDTWRAEVAREALAAGADVVNDAWGGVDPELAVVAAEAGAGIVCTHAGGLPPRTRPHGVTYDDVVADIVRRTTALAEAAVAAGVERDRVLIDPGHDFGKNTRHSLEATRRLGKLVATGWPVLMAL